MRKVAATSLMAFMVACGTQESSRLDIIGGSTAPIDQTKKGLYPASIQITDTTTSKSCSAVRVSRTVFLTAAHCLSHARVGADMRIVASNSKSFDVHLAKFSIHPTYSLVAGSLPIGSDMGTFQLAFGTGEQAAIFDKFVDIAPVGYGPVNVDDPVTIAGWGCEKKVGVPSSSCQLYPANGAMKYASSKIRTPPFELGTKLEKRTFELDAVSDKPGINGFASDGDSGGPIYNAAGQVIGVTSYAGPAILTGDDAFLGTSEMTWLGYSDVASMIQGAIQVEPSSPVYYQGFVNVRYLNGDSYAGIVANGFRNGKGTLVYADQKIYSGNWLNDVRSGYGEQQWPVGSKYTSYKGEWANDLPNGRGVLAFTSGHVYSGQLVNAKYEGEGQLSYPNGDVRTGKFSNGLREGEFVLVTADGKVYIETFKNDVRLTVTLKQ